MNENFKKDYKDAVLKPHNATHHGSETWVKRQRGRVHGTSYVIPRVALLNRIPYEK